VFDETSPLLGSFFLFLSREVLIEILLQCPFVGFLHVDEQRPLSSYASLLKSFRAKVLLSSLEVFSRSTVIPSLGFTYSFIFT